MFHAQGTCHCYVVAIVAHTVGRVAEKHRGGIFCITLFSYYKSNPTTKEKLIQKFRQAVVELVKSVQQSRGWIKRQQLHCA